MQTLIPRSLSLALTATLLAALSVGCTTDDKPKTSDSDTSASADATSGDDGTGTDGTSGSDAAGGSDSTSGSDAATADSGSSDAGATDTGPAAKYTTCPEVGDCVAKACEKNEKDCEKACLAEASNDALLKAAPLLSCYQTKCIDGACKDSKEEGCANDCLSAMCTADFIKCIDTPAKGTKTCGTAFSCFDGCDIAKGDGFACYSKCIDALSDDDVKLLVAMGECMAKNPGKDPEKVCGTEMITCMIGTKTGTKGCASVFSCSEDCQKAGGKDDECMVKCLGDITKEAQGAFVKVMPCLGDDEKMAEKECQTAMKGCIDPSGTATCAETFSCISKCPDDKGPGCMFDCMSKTDSKGYDQAQEISACFMADEATPASTPGGATPTGNDGPDPECIKTIITCAAPSGQGKCPDLLKCMDDCEDKSSGDDNGLECVFACAPKVTQAAFDNLMTLSTCSDKCEKQCEQDKDKDTCEGACMLKDCPAAAKACSPPK